MIASYRSLFFSVLLNVAFSENVHREIHVENKNIFIHPIKLYVEPCRTSLGEHGICVPLNDCKHLREYAEEGGHQQLAAIKEDFGCRFGEIIFVCCATTDPINPFITPSHIASERPPDWSGASTGISSTGYGGHVHTNNQQGFHNRKPSRGEFHDEGVIGQNFHTNNPSSFGSGGFNEPNGQASFSGRPSSGFNFDQPGTFARPADQGFTNTGHIGRPINQGFGNKPSTQNGGNSQGSQLFGSSDYQRPPQESPSRPFQSGSGNNRPGSQSLGASRPFDEDFGTPGSDNYGIGNTRPDKDKNQPGYNRPSNQPQINPGGYTEQGSFGSSSSFGGASRPFDKDFGTPGSDNYGIGNTRPDKDKNQPGYNRPGNQPQINSGGYTEQGSSGSSSSFGGASRPFDKDFGTPGSDNYGIGNTRPNKGKNKPGNNRPGNKPQINSGGYTEQGSFGSSNIMNGQRPNKGGSQRQHPNRRLLPDGNCGIEISDKIIGGTDANLDEFPWMVLLHFSSRSGQDRGHGCGGSLISDRYVLTAGHCIKGPSLPKNTIVDTVRLGEYDLTKERDCINGVCSPPPIDAAVESVIVHPDYKPNDRGQLHDIALIRLKKKVNFNSYVSPICLPGTDHKTKDFSGRKLIVSGWGKTANGADGKSSAVKQKVSLPFVPTENCKTFYENINIHLKNTQICAGGDKDKDSCQGDSGGPLMSNEIANGQPSWFVTGIVSFGPENCGLKNIAGVYTKVSEYLDWVLDNMKE